MTNQEAIERLIWVRKRICDITYSPESFEAINLAIKELEERPKGEWIKESEETGILGIKYTCVKCSECGWSNSLVIPKNFCPNCGAKMRKEEQNAET